tara:strand:- start:4111 stop:4416 length:306 start_codon:yes stop_codon:yes gene_type:complete
MKKQIKKYIKSLKWKWKETQEGYLTHNHGHLIGHPTPVIHYSTYPDGTVKNFYEINNPYIYYIYYYDDNKDDQYFSTLGQAIKSIEIPLIQAYINKLNKES